MRTTLAPNSEEPAKQLKKNLPWQFSTIAFRIFAVTAKTHTPRREIERHRFSKPRNLFGPHTNGNNSERRGLPRRSGSRRPPFPLETACAEASK